MKRVIVIAALMAWGSAMVQVVSADQAASEAAIREAVELYVAAYNRGDAKAVAEMWSPEAVYTNPASGEQGVAGDRWHRDPVARSDHLAVGSAARDHGAVIAEQCDHGDAAERRRGEVRRH